MFQTRPKYVTLKTSLQIAINRLKILQAKKSEEVQKLKKEIANYIKNRKYLNARIKAEKIFRDEAYVEGLELIEMFCDQLLERYELFKQMKEPDDSLTTPISSLIWVVPYYQTQVGEMKIILKQLVAKYGNKFCRKALKNKNGNVSSELIERVRLSRPSNEKIENYLRIICTQYGVTYREQEDKLSKGNHLDNQKICEENSEMVNKVSEIINKVKQQNSQTEFHGKGTSNKCVFSKPKFHKTSKKNKVEAGKCNSSSDAVPNNDVTAASPYDNTNEYCQLNKSILSSIEKLNEPDARYDENLIHENLKIEEIEKINFGAYNPPFLSKSQIYANNFQPLYEEPPPPYSYECINNSNNQAGTNNAMMEYFNDYQLPTCPSENPESDLPSESNNPERKD